MLRPSWGCLRVRRQALSIVASREGLVYLGVVSDEALRQALISELTKLKKRCDALEKRCENLEKALASQTRLY